MQHLTALIAILAAALLPHASFALETRSPAAHARLIPAALSPSTEIFMSFDAWRFDGSWYVVVFCPEADGAFASAYRFTAEVKDGALVTRTDIMGVYKIPGFGKDVNPDDIVISCAKDGYTEANVVRRPRDNGDTKDPIEVECYLKHK